MNINPRVQAAIEKAAALKMEEQGEPLTEQDVSRIYMAQYMKDREAGNTDDYSPEEIKELEKRYQQQQKTLLHFLAKIVSDVKAGNFEEYGDDDPEALRQLADQLLTGDKANDILKIIENENKRTYRTQTAAHKAGAVVKLSPQLAIPTLKPYQFAMSLYQDRESAAYLQPLAVSDNLIFDNGRMYFNDNEQTREITEVELQRLKTKEGIESIDLSLLQQFYSIIFYSFQQSGYREPQDVIKIFLPRIAENLGWKPNFSKKNIDEFLGRMQSYHNIVGVFHGTRNGKPVESYFPVLNFEGYDESENSISFSSPYMNYIIKKIYKGAIRRNKDGTPQFRKNSHIPLLEASHSFLINSSIGAERNKAAIENVIIIVQLIEQAGSTLPNIGASTIISRNPQLQERLESSSNKQQLLKRVFSKTWELLKTKTNLAETYTGIGVTTNKAMIENATPLQQINPKDPTLIPNMLTLDSTIFYFPHNGKK